MAPAPRPFTVIGGFLGAGKTTLVNRILAEPAGLRYAVLVNDFGAVNVDSNLIAAHDGRTIALTNGCVCCSLADGFVTTMLRLMQDQDSFDHIIVEASGVSLPDRIMDFARLDPALAQDAIIVLVDVETLIARLEDRHVGEVVAAQIRSADLILLTKLDIADSAASAGAEAAVRRLNPDAPIVRTDPSDAAIGALLGAGATHEKAGEDPHPHVSFFTETLRAETPVALCDLERFSASLPAGVLRGKGRVALEGREAGVLWQRVGMRTEMTPLTEAPEISEIVLIAAEPMTDLPKPPAPMASVV